MTQRYCVKTTICYVHDIFSDKCRIHLACCVFRTDRQRQRVGGTSWDWPGCTVAILTPSKKISKVVWSGAGEVWGCEAYRLKKEKRIWCGVAEVGIVVVGLDR